MSRELYSPDDRLPVGAPPDLVAKARDSGRKLARIVMDEAEGVSPGHSGYGFVQWSVRPYRVGDGCDGSRDQNVKYVLSVVCDRLGWSIKELFEAAYPDEDEPISDAEITMARRESAHTQLPDDPLSPVALGLLLYDLYAMNYRSLEAEIEYRLGKADVKFQDFLGAVDGFRKRAARQLFAAEAPGETAGSV